jgi:hypothetical protein
MEEAFEVGAQRAFGTSNVGKILRKDLRNACVNPALATILDNKDDLPGAS